MSAHVFWVTVWVLRHTAPTPQTVSTSSLTGSASHRPGEGRGHGEEIPRHGGHIIRRLFTRDAACSYDAVSMSLLSRDGACDGAARRVTERRRTDFMSRAAVEGIREISSATGHHWPRSPVAAECSKRGTQGSAGYRTGKATEIEVGGDYSGKLADGCQVRDPREVIWS